MDVEMGGTRASSAKKRVQTSGDSSSAKRGKSSDNQKRGKDLDKDSLQDLLVQVAKLALGSAREVAVIRSVVMKVATFEKEASKIPDIVKQETAGYTAEVRALEPKDKEDFGPPHPFIWHALMKFLGAIQAQEGPKYPACHAHVVQVHEEAKKNQAALPEEAQKDIGWHMREIYAQHVKVLRVRRTWNAKIMKLEMAVSEEILVTKAATELMDYLKKEARAKIRVGAAPKTEVERKVQKLLEKIAPRELENVKGEEHSDSRK
eukprot:TRINITY_DN28491_c0_g1_i1.p2 TRINITY_DN28491_c0_g1~~TRINITY_DN28491_c0_g1_i1.p2  ORF type:complete len:262 (+),score=89.82 TRINITY_DN28491_c0_g1_i1:1248-2033(+)